MGDSVSALARLLAEFPTDIPAALIDAGFADSTKRDELAELLAQHSEELAYDDDSDSYCDCGKWLEYDYYELPDHQASVLKRSGLLLPESEWPHA